MSKDWRDLSTAEVVKIAENAGKWIASDTGRKKIEAAQKQAEIDITRLSKERVLDPQLLKMPLNL